MSRFKHAASGVVALSCAISQAQELQAVAIESPNPSINTEVAFLISMVPREPNYCGLRIDWGDGQWKDHRVENPSQQIRVTHKYERAGAYTLTVQGKFLGRGLRSAGACDGSPRTISVKVQDPEILRQQAEAERAASQQRIDQEARRRAEAQLQEERLKAQALQRQVELERRERELAVRERELQVRAEAEAKAKAEAREREEAEARKRRETNAAKKPDAPATTTPTSPAPAAPTPPKPPTGF